MQGSQLSPAEFGAGAELYAQKMFKAENSEDSQSLNESQ
jgi:hypothetical protein